MKYEIDYIESDGSIDTEHWTGSLEDAQRLAEAALVSGTHVRSEIRDGSGKVVFRRPRAVHGA